MPKRYYSRSDALCEKQAIREQEKELDLWSSKTRKIVSGFPAGRYMSNWSSIFIPRVHHEMTRQDLVDIVEKKLNLGKVSRVDFAASKNGAGKMAFIHMAIFYDTLFTFNVRSHMEKYGYWKLPEKYQRNSNIKIRFVINRNPVPKTEFTMKTMADMLTRQSYIIEHQSADINDLYKRLEKIEYRDRVQHYKMRQEEYNKDMEEYVEYVKEWEDYEKCREREEGEI